MVSLILLIYPLNKRLLTNLLLPFEFQQRLSLSPSPPCSGDSASDLPTAFRASGADPGRGFNHTCHSTDAGTISPQLLAARLKSNNPLCSAWN